MKPGDVFEGMDGNFYKAHEHKGSEIACDKCDLLNTSECYEAPDCEPLEFSLYYTLVYGQRLAVINSSKGDVELVLMRDKAETCTCDMPVIRGIAAELYCIKCNLKLEEDTK